MQKRSNSKVAKVVDMETDDTEPQRYQPWQVPEKHMTELKPKRVIGSGSFGYVFEAYDARTQQKVAIKRTTKAGEYVSREFEVLEKLRNCKNCIQMLDIYYSKTDDGKRIQNIVFEYCSQDLEEVIKKAKEENQPIPIAEIKDYMRQILTGMAYVHAQGICHRDLKPENILKTEDGIVKICDFGSAKFMTKGGLNTPYIVSRYYRAPELILACSDYTNKIDIWAIGCIFAEFLNQKPLFPGKSEGAQLIEQIAILGLPTREQMLAMSRQIDDTKIDLVHKIDDIPRRDFRKIIPDKYYKKQDIENAADLIEKMLDWVPSQRISCAEALNHPFFK